MIRAITILMACAIAFAMATASAVGQEQTALENPFRIFLDDKAIVKLKTTPEGLIWNIPQPGQVEYDGVHVYYETRPNLASVWSINDKTTQDLFSLDVDDEILDVLVNDPTGLPAGIQPIHRGHIRGVLLRYTPSSSTGGLAPDPNIGPIGNEPPSLNKDTSSKSGVSVADSNQFNALLDSRSTDSQLNAIRDSQDAEADRVMQAWQAHRSDAAKSAQSQNFPNSRAQFSSDNPNSPAFPTNASRQQSNSNSASDRFVSSTAQMDSVLSPPPRQTVQPDQSYRQEMLVNQPSRTSNSYVPQVAMNEPNLMSAANLGTVANADLINNGLNAEITALNQRLLAAQKTLDEAGRRQVFLLFMLFLSIGVCLYLAWLARGFHFRYSELADELRETFTSTN